MLAVLRTGGKQYRVQQGDVIRVEKLAGSAGENVVFDDVLLVARDDGKVEVGTPSLGSAKVKGEILEHGRGTKLTVFKFKRRKGYRRKQGHRQNYTSVRITDISA